RFFVAARGHHDTDVAGPENRCALWRYTCYGVALLRTQTVQFLGDLGGGRVDREQPLQLLDRQVRLPRLRVDLGQVLGRGAVPFVQLKRAPQLRDGGAHGARVGGGLPEQGPTQRGAEVRLVGDQPRCLAQGLDGLVVTARLEVLQADFVQRTRRCIRRRGCGRRAAGGRRRVQPRARRRRFLLRLAVAARQLCEVRLALGRIAQRPVRFTQLVEDLLRRLAVIFR